MSTFEAGRVARIGDTIAGHVEGDDVGGVAWLAACGDDVHVGAAGRLTARNRHASSATACSASRRCPSRSPPSPHSSSSRIIDFASTIPIDDLLPELADRRVLVDPQGPIDGDTVPAHRPITLHDVLTFRTGIGMDFDAPFPQPLLQAMDDLGIATAPPAPQVAPGPDEWIGKLGTLPLLHQPGERWTYHYSSDVLGVLIAARHRAALRGRTP